MKQTVVVVAPHPDDETLGCAGTLMKHKKNGDEIHWVIVTAMSAEVGYKPEQIEKREQEIRTVASKIGFSETHKLGYITTLLDKVPKGELVQKMAELFKKIQPTIIYTPYAMDAHSDHEVVAKAVHSASKWFRQGSVKRVLAYETISETEFGLNSHFVPNVYVGIDDFFKSKLETLKIYQSEVGKFPQPRSVEAVTALNQFRGSSSGYQYAEAFMLIKEIQ